MRFAYVARRTRTDATNKYLVKNTSVLPPLDETPRDQIGCVGFLSVCAEHGAFLTGESPEYVRQWEVRWRWGEKKAGWMFASFCRYVRTG